MDRLPNYDHWRTKEMAAPKEEYEHKFGCCECDSLVTEENLHDCDDCDQVFCSDCMISCKDPQCDEKICLRCCDKQWGYCGRCLKEARESGREPTAEPSCSRTDAGSGAEGSAPQTTNADDGRRVINGRD